MNDLTLSLGERSHGTLRTPDLLNAVADDIARIWKSEDCNDLSVKRLLDDCRICARKIDELDGNAVMDAIGVDVLNDAIDALNDYVPAFCYYGMAEGDGASLGVWVDWTAIDDAVMSGEITKITDLDDLDYLNDQPDMALLVNCHGNATLYSLTSAGTYKRVWDVV